MLSLDTPLKNILSVTPRYARALEKLGLLTARDFLFYFPFRYDDFSRVITLSEEHLGSVVTVSATVTRTKLNRIFRRKMTIAEAYLEDENGTPLKAVWFNQPFVLESMPAGTELRLSGKLDRAGKYFSLTSPAWERASREKTNTGQLVPVYSETPGITSKWLRWQMKILLEKKLSLEDYVPEDLRQKLHLYPLLSAIRQIHFPENQEKLLIAQKTFAFREMFLIQLKTLQLKNIWEAQSAVSLKFDKELVKQFAENLPFQLTGAQRKASFEIIKDLEKSIPMNRLLNGDVGAGKTVVAAIAALGVLAQGYQVAILAPTEVLAFQHFQSFCQLFQDYGFNLALLTSSYKELNNFQSNPNDKISDKITRQKMLENIKSGEVNLVIGTHAIIQKDVAFKNLALVIIDEQHRFGVTQRSALQNVAQTNADLERTYAERAEESLLHEDLSYKIRGAVFAVKKQLGLGHKESIYQKALAEEFKNLKLNFEKEKSISIKYNGKKIGTYRPDFIIENKIILELKALPSIGKFEKQQVWHYLKGSDYELALLANFGRNDIEFERIIHTSPQRSAYSPRKSALVPHLLTMTATPIPRTLAIAFFGSLDLSVLDELPKNRRPIKTSIITPAQRQQVYAFMRREITAGRQVFVILPLVEESQALAEVKAVTAEHKKLSAVFPEYALGLLHGRLKAKEKEAVMRDFKDQKTQILVATSVVEVGIDIPNATIMLIENADRFGLAQLHQFRGRVGRGEHQSYCFLAVDTDERASLERLRALEKSNDGFVLAQKDLELRGPGQLLGKAQSGLSDIAMENLSNLRLIKIARTEAQSLLRSDPRLEKHPLIADALKKFAKDVHLE